jgi:hypothetical protein
MEKLLPKLVVNSSTWNSVPHQEISMSSKGKKFKKPVVNMKEGSFLAKVF